MELSLLCDVKVLMCIVDKNEKTTLYSSEDNIKNFISSYLLKQTIAKNIILNNDYKELFIEGMKGHDYDESKEEEESVVSKESESDNESMCPPKLNKRKRREEDVKTETVDNDKTIYDMGSEMTFNQHLSSHFDTEKKDEGLVKIKKKLSLKVLIPDENRKNSIEMSKEKDKNEIESNDSINSFLQNNNPLSIFSQGALQKDFPKKDIITENNINNNFGHFSPNFSAGSLKAFSPYYNSISQTPNLQGYPAANYFMFNNNNGTPLKNGGVHNLNFPTIYNPHQNTNTNTNTLCNMISEEMLKNKRTSDEPLNNNNNYQNSNINLNINNVSSNPTIINLANNKYSNSTEDTKILIPTPGRNLGFYSWVIHGSPVLHNNPMQNTGSIIPARVASKKKKKAKKD